jgi:hypothetical protein
MFQATSEITPPATTATINTQTVVIVNREGMRKERYSTPKFLYADICCAALSCAGRNYWSQ